GRLAGVWQFGAHIADSAASIALILPAGLSAHERETAEYDLGQATMQMMITASDLGIGTGHSAVGDQDVARDVRGLPQDRVAAYVLDLGYPADRPLRPIKRPGRREFADVVHRGTW